MSVRQYQTDAEDATFNWLNNSTALGGVIAQPTGVGKSHTQANIIRRAMSYRQSARIMGLTHVKALITQNANKLIEAWPHAPLGIYSAGLKQRNMTMPITFGGIASVHKVIKAFGPQDLLFIDECHLLNPNAEGMYKTLVDMMLEQNKYLRVIGLTATWWRQGLGSIVDGSIFQDKIIDQTGVDAFNWFVEQGYLVKLIPRPTATKYDFSGVGITGGDYNQTEAAKAFDQAAITQRALQELCYYGHDRRKWLIFATGVDHAEHITDMLNAMGVPTTCVHNRLSDAENDKRIEAHRRGDYRCIVNANKLTTGYDDPEIDLIGVLRLTMSVGLWVQMLGRGTRPYYVLGGYGREILDTWEGRHWAIQMGGKLNCLVLDFAGNTARLGPINDPVLPHKAGPGGGPPPIKICETKKLKWRDNGAVGCGAYNHPTTKFCDNCNNEFDFSVKFGAISHTDELITMDGPIMEWFDISHVFYEGTVGPSGKPYLRVTYWSGKKKFIDMVFLGSDGYLLHKAKGWWSARFRGEGIPPDVSQALPYANRQWLKEPRRVLVHSNKKPYPEIQHYEYE